MFPYGVKGLPTSFDAKNAFSANLVILLGSNDTDPNHKYLRKTEEALRQGKNRFERGENYHRTATHSSQEQGLKLIWKQQIVQNVGHSNKGMSKTAVKIIRDTEI